MHNPILMGFGLAIPAGLNAFIPLLVVALADRISDSFNLIRPYDFLSSTSGILIVLGLLTVEITVDKIPRADHLNDLIQSAIRPAAGAVIFMAVVNEDGALHPLVAMLFGLLVAGGVHWYKTMARPGINMRTQGIGAPVVSMAEDGIAVVTSVLAIAVPLIGILASVASLFLLRVIYRRVGALRLGQRRSSLTTLTQ